MDSAIDLRVDVHAHTGMAVGRDSVGVLVTAAERAGLTRLTFADQVGPESAWLPMYQESILRAQHRTELDLRVAVEVEIVRADGWMAFPRDLGGLQALSLAMSRLPLPAGPADPRRVRELLASGALRRADVIEFVVNTTARAVERAGRYAPTQLARPLNLLNQLGIEEQEIEESVLTPLITACRVTRAVVEVSETWRSPSPWLARLFAEGGVTLGAASDARDAEQVGRWRYVRQVGARLGHPSPL